MEDQGVKGFPRGGIQYRSCNITCLTMILHYYSIIDQLLEHFWIFFCFFFHATSFLLEYYVAFFMSTMLY